MLDYVIAAFERQDYQAAAQLLQPLLQTSPENPWVQFYAGRLYEELGELESAQKVYRSLLKNVTNTKLLSQIRQGLQRLETLIQEQRQRGIAQATTGSNNNQLGVLVLEAISSESKTVAAQNFAQIMEIEPYAARLQLPSRGWRFYKSGTIGELQFLGQELRAAGIPCFWANIAEINQIRVFQVSYIQHAEPQATVICQNEQGQMGAMSFEWSEVSDRILGLLPIFEQVVDRDVRGKLQRKTKTQDYAHFCDLVLPSRGCILRIHDNSYEYQKGVTKIDKSDRSTIRISWNSLLDFLSLQLPTTPIWSDFSPFAETVIDQIELLKRIPSNIHLFRRTPSTWDSAFMLYSTLVSIKAANKKEENI
ncbi:tetratricopeptide repeat protein [Synechocystis sp. PCC 7509]|uniref:tetratricopeptide repeat protein n=1 Tax=Synechocystis sp. PCC 7509 TaxID=927677 RepID=UPI0002AB9AD4|nr:tetratricopeptide repeat protein [Synechocystis sp. PCC 7509]